MTPACDTVGGTCVECMPDELSRCTMVEPVCGADHTCRGCIAHSECASGACLDDGSCGSDANVLFVAEGAPTTNTECTQAAPCSSFAKALMVAPARPYLKVTGAITENVNLDNRDLIILADPEARLRNTTGTLLSVKNASNVTVYDLTIGDTTPKTTNAIDLANNATGTLTLERVTVTKNAAGIRAFGGRLVVQRSTISDNTEGGIHVYDAALAFTIRNNFIYYNGRSTGGTQSAFGGVQIDGNTLSGKVELNTIAKNESNGSPHPAGLACYGTGNSAAGNLIYGNVVATGSVVEPQLGASSCQRGNTFTSAAVAGDLGLVLASGPAPDFHLTAATPATVLDAGGDCTAMSDHDHDGDPRPAGAGCDLGADEYEP